MMDEKINYCKQHKGQSYDNIFPEIETLEQTKQFCFERITSQLKSYQYELGRMESLSAGECLEEDKGVELLKNCHMRLVSLLDRFFFNLESEYKSQMQKKQDHLKNLKFFQDNLGRMAKELDQYFVQFQSNNCAFKQIKEFLTTDYELELAKNKQDIDDFLVHFLEDKIYLKCEDDQVDRIVLALNDYVCIYQQNIEMQQVVANVESNVSKSNISRIEPIQQYNSDMQHKFRSENVTTLSPGEQHRLNLHSNISAQQDSSSLVSSRQQKQQHHATQSQSQINQTYSNKSKLPQVESKEVHRAKHELTKINQHSVQMQFPSLQNSMYQHTHADSIDQSSDAKDAYIQPRSKRHMKQNQDLHNTQRLVTEPQPSSITRSEQSNQFIELQIAGRVNHKNYKNRMQQNTKQQQLINQNQNAIENETERYRQEIYKQYVEEGKTLDLAQIRLDQQAETLGNLPILRVKESRININQQHHSQRQNRSRHNSLSSKNATVSFSVNAITTPTGRQMQIQNAQHQNQHQKPLLNNNVQPQPFAYPYAPYNINLKQMFNHPLAKVDSAQQHQEELNRRFMQENQTVINYNILNANANSINNNNINHNDINPYSSPRSQKKINPNSDLDKPFLILSTHLINQNEIQTANRQLQQMQQIQQNKENMTPNQSYPTNRSKVSAQKSAKQVEVEQAQTQWLFEQKNNYERQRQEKLKYLVGGPTINQNQNQQSNMNYQQQNNHNASASSPSINYQKSYNEEGFANNISMGGGDDGQGYQQQRMPQNRLQTSPQSEVHQFNYDHNIQRELIYSEGQNAQQQDYNVTMQNYFRSGCKRKYLHFFQPKSNFLYILDLDKYDLSNNAQQSLEFQQIVMNISFKVPRWAKSIITPLGDLFLTGGVRIEEPQDKLGLSYYYDFTLNSLLPIDSMNVKRSGHAIVFFKNEIYVIGGCGSENQFLNKCEKYSLKDSKWVPIANMSFQANNPYACVLNNKYILKVGGKLDDHFCNKVMEYYNPAFNTWQTIDYKILGDPHSSEVLNFKLLSQSACIQINSSQVFVFGGTHENFQQKSSTAYLIEFELNDQQMMEQHLMKAIIKRPNQMNLPFAEGFWSNPVIWNQEIFALQNVCNELNSSIVYLNKRRLLKFNAREGWKTLI